MRRALAISTLWLLALAPAACTTTGDGGDGDLASCGNIDIEANAECSVELEGGCTAQCVPLNFTASCRGECGATFDAGCTATCSGECGATCEVDPPSFSCEGECSANCGASCGGHCEADSNSGSCEASCQATCDAECGISCEGTGGSADCTAKCDASCEGECTVEANIDCNLDCQASLQGGCEVECESPEGALFCDGQYVDHGGNLEDCITALNAYLDVEVDASASAACEGNSCSAEAEASISCAMAKAPALGNSGDSAPWWMLAASVLGLGTMRRRRS